MNLDSFNSAAKMIADYQRLQSILKTMTGASLSLKCIDSGASVPFPPELARVYLTEECQKLAAQLKTHGVCVD